MSAWRHSAKLSERARGNSGKVSSCSGIDPKVANIAQRRKSTGLTSKERTLAKDRRLLASALPQSVLSV